MLIREEALINFFNSTSVCVIDLVVANSTM